MADNRRLLMAECIDQIGEVEHMKRTEVSAVRRPLAIAMSAQVGRNNVPTIPHRMRRPIPAARVITRTVDEQEKRRAFVPPINIVELQALRDMSS